MSDVLAEVRSDWKEVVDQAYSDAQERLEEEIMGERVVLRFPKPYLGDARKSEVEGIPASINVGRIPAEGVEFAVSVEFENGDRWTDPEEIEIVEDPETVMPGTVSREWRHVNDVLPAATVPGAPYSEKVEVYLDTGARQLDRYSVDEQMWETEIENLEETGMIGERVEYWKPLEPDPQIEGRYQHER